MILITGATGHVGANLVRELVARGEAVRAFVRDPRRAREVLGDDVELVEGDLDRRETMDAAVDGADCLYLLAPSSPRLAEQERHVLEAAKRAEIRVIKHSWLVADEHSPVATGRSHWLSERELERSGLPYTILEPASFMDNFLFMVRGGMFATAAEDAKVAMVDARDVAAVAAVVVAEEGHEGKTYVITGPEAVTFDEAATILTDAVGVDIRHVRVPQDQFKVATAQATGSEWLAELLAALHGLYVAGREEAVTDVVPQLTSQNARSLADFARYHAETLARLATNAT